jgi:iron complex transport system substrate-binding protein
MGAIMRRFWPLLLFVAIMAAVVWLLPRQAPPADSAASDSDYQRIVSLSPAITETVFALGLGDKVVAVTDYCDYPQAAQALPTVGGYTDTSLEAIVAQQPDLVIMLQAQQRLQQQLQQLGIKTHAVDTSGLMDIEAAIASIGQLTGRQQQADAVLADIHQLIERVTTQVAGEEPVRTLISIAHYVNSDQLETVYVAGQQDFYNDLLDLAGGRNVYTSEKIPVPSVSREGIIRMNPDVIIDVFPEAEDHQSNMQQVRQQWQQLEMIKAVQAGRVHILERDYASVPGPRVFQLLPDFARLLHPQLNWEQPDD